MEAERRRVLRRRKPLADRTNTSPPSLPLKSIKPNLSSSSSSGSNKPPPKRASITDLPSNLDNPLNPSSPAPPPLSTPSLKTSSRQGAVDRKAPEPISVFFSPKRSSSKRKDKGKEVADEWDVFSSSREKGDEVQSEKLPKALTVPCIKIKKRRPVSSEEDKPKDHELLEFIEKQKAYFKMIDEFELSEEEVESADQLD